MAVQCHLVPALVHSVQILTSQGAYTIEVEVAFMSSGKRVLKRSAFGASTQTFIDYATEQALRLFKTNF